MWLPYFISPESPHCWDTKYGSHILYPLKDQRGDTEYGRHTENGVTPDPQAWAVDALSLPWEGLDPYAFPPAVILDKVVENLQDYSCRRIILIALGWPNMPWFWDLVAMSNQIPLSLLKLAHSAIQSDSSQESVIPKSACMAPGASAIKQQGFSEAVAA